MRKRHLLCGFLAIVLVQAWGIGIERYALAQEEADPVAGSVAADEPIGYSSGSFTQSIPIQVPPFRGLEPNLAFRYDSSDGNGPLGVGWSISGLSQIVRNSPGYGSPRHDASDIFVLDGSELVPCTAPGVNPIAPSCYTGGTPIDYYVTEVESYLRIKRIPATNIWQVWTRNGTKLTYKPLSQWGTYSAGNPNEVKLATDYRWLLSEVTDTHGQTVTYAYVCQPSIPDCYINTITYGGATIKFYWEARADDPISYATGAGLGRITYRLKTVEVKLDAQTPPLVRAYALTYGAPAGKATTRSRPAGIQQFGKDAAVDQTTGAITGGTSLPPVTLVASDIAGTTGTFAKTTWQAGAGTFTGGKWLPADLNGDGKTDFVKGQLSTCKINVQLSSGSAFTSQQWSVTGCAATSGSAWVVGDFNGDGRSDVAQLTASPLTAHVYLSTGSEFSYVKFINATGTIPSGATLLPADLDGDGKTDLISNKVTTAATCATNAWISTGSTFLSQSWATTPSCASAIPTSALSEVGDFNGDGKADLVRRYYDANGWANFSMRISTGTAAGGFAYSNWTGAWIKWPGDRWFSGDYNGDSKTDFIQVWPNSGQLSIAAWLAAGDGFTSGPANGLIGVSTWLTTASNKWVIGDFNGDGRADLAVTSGALSKMFRATGSGSLDAFTLEDWETGTGIYSTISTAARAVGDFNGDGKNDIADYRGPTNFIADVHASTGPMPDLVTGVTNSLGGGTTVQYTPSSAWTNTNLPMIVQTVSSVTANDGRGNASTTDYTYSGGLWNQQKRRFRGFSTVVAKLPPVPGETPAQRPTRTIGFMQTIASAGQIDFVEYRNGAGTLLRKNDEQYNLYETTLPFRALNTVSEVYVYDAGGANKHTQTFRSFNSYGVLTNQTNWGDVDRVGDEYDTAINYYPNTASYIVGLPASIRILPATEGSKITETQFLYDGAGTHTTPPVKGDVTKVRKWLDTTGNYIESTAEYDSYRNVTATVDPLLARTEFTYDSTYHLFVTETRDPLYFPPANDVRHKTTATWNYACTAPEDTHDLNNLMTNYDYDPLCRLTRTDAPGGAFAVTTYNSIGSPTAQK